jgi:hypothetical protein
MWSFPRTLFGPLFDRPALVPRADGAKLCESGPARKAPPNPPKARPAPARAAAPAPSLPAPARAFSPAPSSRAQLRDRYIAARFCGMARGAADLRSPEAVVRAARLYFEEERADLATEMLSIAEEELPGEASIALARLELLYLCRERDPYERAARRFLEAHPGHEAWAAVARLGRKLEPASRLFASDGPADAADHYGPWPHLPNWIQAPWDLCAEVLAADFHRTVRTLAAAPVAPQLSFDGGGAP